MIGPLAIAIPIIGMAMMAKQLHEALKNMPEIRRNRASIQNDLLKKLEASQLTCDSDKASSRCWKIMKRHLFQDKVRTIPSIEILSKELRPLIKRNRFSDPDLNIMAQCIRNLLVACYMQQNSADDTTAQ
jgi:hypothetical protein